MLLGSPGTILLEFAALSRLSGEPIFEIKATKAMDALWKIRNRGSDLMGKKITFSIIIIVMNVLSSSPECSFCQILDVRQHSVQSCL